MYMYMYMYLYIYICNVGFSGHAWLPEGTLCKFGTWSIRKLLVEQKKTTSEAWSSAPSVFSNGFYSKLPTTMLNVTPHLNGKFLMGHEGIDFPKQYDDLPKGWRPKPWGIWDSKVWPKTTSASCSILIGVFAEKSRHPGVSQSHDSCISCLMC